MQVHHRVEQHRAAVALPSRGRSHRSTLLVNDRQQFVAIVFHMREQR